MINIYSNLLGYFDILFSYIAPYINSFYNYSWFWDGLGDIYKINLLCNKYIKYLNNDNYDNFFKINKLNIIWYKEEYLSENIKINYGKFLSPFHESLKDNSKYVFIAFVYNIHNWTIKNNKIISLNSNKIFIDFPATGIINYTKTFSYVKLLTQNNIGVFLITPLYYGDRTVLYHNKLHFINNIANYQLQTLTIIFEGLLLVDYLWNINNKFKIACGGISWGGSIAACVSLISKIPLRTITYMGGSSPRVMILGAIKTEINKNLLNNINISNLVNIFENGITYYKLQTKSFINNKNIHKITQISCKNDYYVNYNESILFSKLLYNSIDNKKNYKLKWINGGHFTGFLLKNKIYVNYIIDLLN